MPVHVHVKMHARHIVSRCSNVMKSITHHLTHIHTCCLQLAQAAASKQTSLYVTDKVEQTLPHICLNKVVYTILLLTRTTSFRA